MNLPWGFVAWRRRGSSEIELAQRVDLVDLHVESVDAVLNGEVEAVRNLLVGL